MDVRHALAVQLWRVQKIGSIASVLLLVLNTSLLLAKAVEWRGFDPKLVVPLVVLVLVALALIAANVWVVVLKMNEFDAATFVQHNPYEVSRLTPRDRFLLRHQVLPQLEAQIMIARSLGLDAREMERSASLLREWEARGEVEEGFIGVRR